MIVRTYSSHSKEHNVPVLTQEDANREKDLQEVLCTYPDILPMESLALEGPLLVVGKEARPGTGAIDLMGLAKGGEIVLIELKKGPENSDFRHALAQLIDYGSQLWKKNLKEFNDLVKQYFDSEQCKDSNYKNKDLCRAMKTRWEGIDQKKVLDKLTQQLNDGDITYVLAAQRFTSSMERQIHYVNHVSTGPRFFAAEIVRFCARNTQEQGIEAFECRIVMQPDDTGSTNRSRTNRIRLQDAVEGDCSHLQALNKLLDYATELELSFGWGTSGVSIRLRSPSGPKTIAWLYPPNGPGYRGLTGITLGYEKRVFPKDPPSYFRDYVEMASQLPGGTGVPSDSIEGSKISPKDLSCADFDRLHKEWRYLVDRAKEE